MFGVFKSGVVPNYLSIYRARLGFWSGSGETESMDGIFCSVRIASHSALCFKVIFFWKMI